MTRRIRWIEVRVLIATLIALAVTLALAEENSTPDFEMKQYFVGLIYRNPEAPKISADESAAIQKGHLDNIFRLADEGLMVLAGPFGDDGDLRGLFFYNVETLEEAEALVRSDPAVQAGRFIVELHPWWGTAELATAFVGKEKR